MMDHNMNMSHTMGMMNDSAMTTMDPHAGHHHNHHMTTTTDPHAGHHNMMHTTSPGGHAGHHDTGSGHTMMKMYFHTGLTETILFYQWQTTNLASMIGSCLGVFFIALLYEGLKVFREHLLRKSNVKVRYNSMPVSTSQDTMIQETHKTVGSRSPRPNPENRNDIEQSDPLLKKSRSLRARMLSCAHLVQTILHILQVIISYLLMLIFMTYNVWLCLAVALGAGAGYFCFGWKRTIVVDINEHCH